ncbi:MAG: enoyl-CoA hydratase/isomerase family protein [Gammaproteobacteria bacterium]|nr:enoyl-CoA hydratase/isomerase family protein [Gammaproteobacteria bacterium]
MATAAAAGAGGITTISGADLAAAAGQQQLASSSWAEIARRELDWAVQLCHHGDFVEGVRALLVDKGRAARWRYGEADAEQMVAQLWPSPWSAAAHPLAMLKD